jgi:N-hydroxyarylamine O-acetyltransferase
VDLDGEPWLADVGFGSTGILWPIPLVAGRAVRQHLWSYRLIEEAGLWRLQIPLTRSAHEGAETDWQDVYAFTLEPHYPPDFEMANHYVSTHPNSRFTQMLTVQLATPAAQHLLRNLEYTVTRSEGSVTRVIEDEELLPLLADTFGLHFPPGTRFRYPAVLPCRD